MLEFELQYLNRKLNAYFEKYVCKNSQHPLQVIFSRKNALP